MNRWKRAPVQHNLALLTYAGCEVNSLGLAIGLGLTRGFVGMTGGGGEGKTTGTGLGLGTGAGGLGLATCSGKHAIYSQ